MSQAEAAKLIGYHTSKVSRIITGETMPTAEHIARLLSALDDELDRAHCLTEYLYDCCPEEYRERVRITHGKLHEDKAASIGRDTLSGNIAVLDKLAEDNSALRELIKMIIKIVKK